MRIPSAGPASDLARTIASFTSGITSPCRPFSKASFCKSKAEMARGLFAWEKK